jgi:hypothetical protein
MGTLVVCIDEDICDDCNVEVVVDEERIEESESSVVISESIGIMSSENGSFVFVFPEKGFNDENSVNFGDSVLECKGEWCSADDKRERYEGSSDDG